VPGTFYYMERLCARLGRPRRIKNRQEGDFLVELNSMRLNFMPKTFLGKWSVALIIAMPIFFYIGMSFVDFYESVPAGKTIPYDIMVRPGVALPMLAGFLCGITAFFTGIIGIIRKKDRSVFVFLSTAMGFLMLLWCLAEVLFRF